MTKTHDRQSSVMGHYSHDRMPKPCLKVPQRKWASSPSPHRQVQYTPQSSASSSGNEYHAEKPFQKYTPLDTRAHGAQQQQHQDYNRVHNMLSMLKRRREVCPSPAETASFHLHDIDSSSSLPYMHTSADDMPSGSVYLPRNATQRMGFRPISRARYDDPSRIGNKRTELEPPAMDIETVVKLDACTRGRKVRTGTLFVPQTTQALANYVDTEVNTSPSLFQLAPFGRIHSAVVGQIPLIGNKLSSVVNSLHKSGNKSSKCRSPSPNIADKQCVAWLNHRRPLFRSHTTPLRSRQYASWTHADREHSRSSSTDSIIGTLDSVGCGGNNLEYPVDQFPALLRDDGYIGTALAMLCFIGLIWGLAHYSESLTFLFLEAHARWYFWWYNIT